MARGERGFAVKLEWGEWRLWSRLGQVLVSNLAKNMGSLLAELVKIQTVREKLRHSYFFGMSESCESTCRLVKCSWFLELIFNIDLLHNPTTVDTVRHQWFLRFPMAGPRAGDAAVQFALPSLSGRGAWGASSACAPDGLAGGQEVPRKSG